MAAAQTSPVTSTDVTAAYRIRKVSMAAPFRWLAAGWRDLWRRPGVSFAYGVIFAAIGVLLAFSLPQAGFHSVIIVLTGGFVLMGPMLAAGLYDKSRRLAAGEPVSFASTLRSGFGAGQLPYIGLFLMLIYFAWVQISFLLFMLFFGPHPMPPLETFVSDLISTPRGLSFLIIGSVVGAGLAASVFAISAIGVPLLMVERIDVVTAALTSIKACRENLGPMLLWAALIACAMAFSFATAFAGLVIMFPWIGHATWHAFNDLVER
jgi:uncharacterized membrane protein